MIAGGAIVASYLTFVLVSYQEVKTKIDSQLARGEEPYQLNVSDSQKSNSKIKKKRRKS